MAASWVALGEQGIFQFAKIREKALERTVIKKGQHSSGGPSGDYFHNGEDVLQAVSSWHQHLRSTCRRSDSITSSVLDLVDQKMLRGDPSERIAAEDLCAELKEIISRSQAASPATPEGLLQMLKEIDETAQTQPVQSRALPAPSPGNLAPGTTQDRKDRKSERLLRLPLMKTTHRSESFNTIVFPSKDSVRVPTTVHEVQEEKTPVVAQQQPSTSRGHPQEQGTEVVSKTPVPPAHQPQSNANSPTPRHPARMSSSLIPHLMTQVTAQKNYQHWWQARMDMERHESRFSLKKRDPLLTPYFGKDRDLVSPR